MRLQEELQCNVLLRTCFTHLKTSVFLTVLLISADPGPGGAAADVAAVR